MAVNEITHGEGTAHNSTGLMELAGGGSSVISIVDSGKECQVCGRAFGRTEHRARHMLTHTREKPYVCPLCGEQFQRPDVLRRHITRYCPRVDEATDSSVAFGRKNRQRVRVACDYCHSKKLKCNGESPCQKCTSKGLRCTCQRETQRRASAHSASSPPNHESTPVSPTSQLLSTENQVNVEDTIDDLAGKSSESIPSSARVYEQCPTAPILRRPNIQNTDLASTAMYDMVMGAPIPEMVQYQGGFGAPLSSASVDLSQFHGFQPTTYPTNMNYFDAFGIFDSDSDHSMWMDLEMNEPFAFDSSFNPAHIATDFAKDSGVSPGLERFKQAVFTYGGPPSAKQGRFEAWLKRPLIPRQYDLEVLETLILVFQRHAETMFTSFQAFEISSHTLPAQILAMAAVGALFSDCAGSEVIAKLYFTDSQRLLNHDIANVTVDSLGKSTSLLQTYIGLELFGLCSGHKRSSEVSEAYHAGLVQFMTDHLSWLDAADPADVHSSYRDTLLDLLILEGYRVTLLQLQPILLPPHIQVIQTLFISLESGHPQQSPPSPSLGTFYQQLACICAMSWFAIGRSDGNYSSLTGQCWRVETIELYSQRFFQLSSAEFANSPSARMLMFTNLLALRAPVEDFHNIAYSFHHIDTTTGTSNSMGPLHQWQQGDDYDLALAHADQVLECAEIIVSKKSQQLETPHDAVCVYLATLVFWISRLTRDQDPEGHADLSTRVEKGILLLTKFRVKVSGVMKQMLLLLNAREHRKI